MQPSGEPRHRASLRGAVRVAAVARIAVLAMVELAACASIPPPLPTSTVRTPPDAGSILLGPWPESGCFQVALVGSDRYRFVLDKMEYPAALGAGDVEITVRAIDIGPLAPQSRTQPRNRRLEFIADGPASGAFEITLTLVDGEGHRSESTRLNRICD
jgi:hypothetical protein